MRTGCCNNGGVNKLTVKSLPCPAPSLFFDAIYVPGNADFVASIPYWWGRYEPPKRPDLASDRWLNKKTSNANEFFSGWYVHAERPETAFSKHYSGRNPGEVLRDSGQVPAKFLLAHRVLFLFVQAYATLAGKRFDTTSCQD